MKAGALWVACVVVLHAQNAEAGNWKQRFLRASLCASLLSAGLLGSEKLSQKMDKAQISEWRSRSDLTWNGENRIANGALSARWHAEYMGSDLVDAEVQKYHRRVGFAIWDQPLHAPQIQTSSLTLPALSSSGASDSEHGALVANLVIGPRTGVTRIGDLRHALNSRSRDSDWIQLASDRRTKLLNISLLLTRVDGGHPAANRIIENRKKLLAALVHEGTIPIIGIGNQAHLGWIAPTYRRFFPRVQNTNQQLPGILVGSMDPNGTVSAFNAHGDDITILTPGGAAILSSQDAANKETEFFFGTSAATGVATGALLPTYLHLDFVSLDEWKIILNATKLPVHGAERLSERNPPGLLNAYRVYHVAERLRRYGWNEAPRNQRNSLLNAALFDFEQEARKIEALPLNGPERASEEIYNELRQVFLLSPTKARALKLKEFCENQGLHEHALFYSRQAELILAH